VYGSPVGTVVWTSEWTFAVDGVEYVCDLYGSQVAHEPRFCLVKHPRVVERLVELLADLQPNILVEVGIYEGASTALLNQLAQPLRLIAFEYNREPLNGKLDAFIAAHDRSGAISIHYGVDQGDAQRLSSIISAELGDTPLDLVIDDASHRLEPSRATFDQLFPRLRPGGLYVLEDWAIGLGPNTTAKPGERRLVELVHDIVTAKGSQPSLIGDINITRAWAAITRGPEVVRERRSAS
jgi:predicted O-methyltransferase YrrM